jgi:DNA-binding NtrC family response regulator
MVWQNLTPPPDAILLDLRLDETVVNNQDGLKLLGALHNQLPSIPLIMITGYPDWEVAVQAMKLGATDFIQKSSVIKSGELKTRLKKALEHSRLTRRVNQLEQELALVEPRRIIGESDEICQIRRIIEVVGNDGEVTVLIRGETGTGKELVARAIHSQGKRRESPFVAVMLNALPQSTLEAELFGHEKGAFTDAREKRLGYLEKAHRGVLFLDEIGDIDLSFQVKLLRFLEEREFQRLGSTKNIPVDVQVIAATNADLEKLVTQGCFREDLYYRLKVHEIMLPPLRNRKADIPLIVEHLLQVFQQRGKKVTTVSYNALQELNKYEWVGNIRQLKNVLESALIKAEINNHTAIENTDLPAEILLKKTVSSLVKVPDMKVLQNINLSIDETLARTELFCVSEALNQVGGRKEKASVLLGYNDRFTFSRRIKRIFKQHPQLALEFVSIHDLFI